MCEYMSECAGFSGELERSKLARGVIPLLYELHRVVADPNAQKDFCNSQKTDDFGK